MEEQNILEVQWRFWNMGNDVVGFITLFGFNKMSNLKNLYNVELYLLKLIDVKSTTA